MLYSPLTSVALSERVFTIENDVEYSSIIESLRTFLVSINPIEVFFSVEFSFYEKGKEKELYDNFVFFEIRSLKAFLSAMKSAVKEKCELCDQLEQKINELNFDRVPKDMLFIDDYVYYGQDSRFEKASRMEIAPPIFR